MERRRNVALPELKPSGPHNHGKAEQTHIKAARRIKFLPRFRNHAQAGVDSDDNAGVHINDKSQRQPCPHGRYRDCARPSADVHPHFQQKVALAVGDDFLCLNPEPGNPQCHLITGLEICFRFLPHAHTRRGTG